MNLQTQYLMIAGPSGDLECAIDGIAQGQAIGTVVISHPHPLFEGTMDNKIVQTIARAYVSQGWRAIRYNFRGVGASAGEYADAIGEVDDLQAVVSQLATKTPLVIAGFSFGSIVSLNWLQRQQQSSMPLALTLVGVPTQRFTPAAIPSNLRATSLVVHGEKDEVAPLSGTMDWARQNEQPIVVVPAAGHFFHGNLTILKTLIINQIKALT